MRLHLLGARLSQVQPVPGIVRIDGLQPAATSPANSSAARACSGSIRSTAADTSATTATRVPRWAIRLRFRPRAWPKSNSSRLLRAGKRRRGCGLRRRARPGRRTSRCRPAMRYS
jgi:hypothetical protein